MRTKIMDIRKGSHAFDEVDEIYPDKIIEIDKFTENPVLMRYESMDPKDQTTRSANPIDQQRFQVFTGGRGVKGRDMRRKHSTSTLCALTLGGRRQPKQNCDDWDAMMSWRPMFYVDCFEAVG